MLPLTEQREKGREGGFTVLSLLSMAMCCYFFNHLESMRRHLSLFSVLHNQPFIHSVNMYPLLCEALWEAPRPCRGSKGNQRPQRQELCSGLLFPSGFAKSSCLAQATWRCWSPSSPSSG